MKNSTSLDNTSVKSVKRLSKSSYLIHKLSKRSQYLRVAKKGNVRSEGFYLQGMQRSEVSGFPADLIRVGFTCSKKVGNAVLRNKAKRRLKHLAREVLPDGGKHGWDYVIVGQRKGTLAISFTKLKLNLKSSLNKLHSAEMI
ncbi:MAG: ribonuclease P protein component [Pseudomonadota bacterium]|nr:ribonuclease P protein component [Pseudomonadota bacterium]